MPVHRLALQQDRGSAPAPRPVLLALMLLAPPAFGHGAEALTPLFFGAAALSIIPAILAATLIRAALTSRILAGLATWILATLLGVAAAVVFLSAGARQKAEANARQMAEEQAQWLAHPMRIAACAGDMARLRSELLAAQTTEEFRFRVLQECAIDQPQPAVLGVFLDNLVPAPRPPNGTAHCPLLLRAREKQDPRLIQVFVDQGLLLNCGFLPHQTGGKQ